MQRLSLHKALFVCLLAFLFGLKVPLLWLTQKGDGSLVARKKVLSSKLRTFSCQSSNFKGGFSPRKKRIFSVLLSFCIYIIQNIYARPVQLSFKETSGLKKMAKYFQCMTFFLHKVVLTNCKVPIMFHYFPSLVDYKLSVPSKFPGWWVAVSQGGWRARA